MTSSQTETLPFRQLWFATLVVAFVLSCAYFWSRWAEVTTTLEISGVIGAEEVEYPLQSAASGPVSEVFVGNFETVEAGTVLAYIDQKADRAALHTTRKNINRLTQEAGLLEKITKGGLGEVQRPSTVYQAVLAAHQAHENELDLLQADAERVWAQRHMTDAEITTMQQWIALERTRFDALTALGENGIASSFQADAQHEEVLEAQLQLDQLEAKLQSASLEHDRLLQNIVAVSAEREAEITARLLDIETRLSELLVREAELSTLVARKSIRAPVDGVVTGWTLVAGQVLGPGQELGHLTRDISDVSLDLRVPPEMVDQIFKGQKGEVRFTSVSQRNLPKIHVQVTSRAAVSREDPVTGVAYFQANSRILDSGLEDLHTALQGRFNLALDIPVQVVLEGRSITFWDYVMEPVAAIWRRAFQD
ncbi:MAG: HlyD family efflux transporter periplasmic adaptor subunit [Pseudomonadota bacterium]